MIVRLPGGKTVVVDAKAPLEAYLDAASIEDEEARRARLLQHAADVKGHMRRLAERGYDAMMGARPMARLIQDKIKRPLAEQILFGELADHGGVVHVELQDGELAFAIETETEPA